ncbi:MAG: hypothetical protein V4710_12730 [Verrucomicrobiota bacterium]
MRREEQDDSGPGSKIVEVVEVGVEAAGEVLDAGASVAEGCFSGCSWIVIVLGLPLGGMIYWLSC